MRTSGILAAVAVVVLAGVWRPGAHADVFSAKGCLEKNESGEFVLESVQGTFELTADEGVDLSAHVGHRVGISGETVAKAEEAEEEHAHVRVENLKHISKECML